MTGQCLNRTIIFLPEKSFEEGKKSLHNPQFAW